jgi:hypothetical protein
MATAFAHPPVRDRLWKLRLAWQPAHREIEPAEPAPGPLPEPTGLAQTLSPVDLPEPAAPLPHPLRWTSEVIAVAALFLLLFNAHALRGWSYQLPPNDDTARVVTLAEGWYDLVGKAGLNRPVEAMHARWQAARDARFGGGAAPKPGNSPAAEG